MTMLISMVDSIRSALGESPLGQSVHLAASSGNQWVLLAGSLGGAVIGAGIGWLAARTTARQHRESAQEELEHERIRVLNERFTTASELLGRAEPASRLAGVHAMAGLADDWHERRQTCIDVLCGYLRLPFAPTPAMMSKKRLAWDADREVYHTVIRLIRDHLRDESSGSLTSWQGYNFDFSGATFDFGSSLRGAVFSGGAVDFVSARFENGAVDLTGVRFCGATVSFQNTQFDGAHVVLHDAEFSGGTVKFFGSSFNSGWVDCEGAVFSGGTVHFRVAQFLGGTLDLRGARFTGGTVEFSLARFEGGKVTFSGAEFSGGTVDLREPSAWKTPPVFDGAVLEHPPEGLLLPQSEPNVPKGG